MPYGKEPDHRLQETVKAAYDRSRETFSGITDEENKEELQLFAFICNLSFDVYLKKNNDRKYYRRPGGGKKAEEEPDKTKEKSRCSRPWKQRILYFSFFIFLHLLNLLCLTAQHDMLYPCYFHNSGNGYPADRGGGGTGFLRDLNRGFLLTQHLGHFNLEKAKEAR